MADGPTEEQIIQAIEDAKNRVASGRKKPNRQERRRFVRGGKRSRYDQDMWRRITRNEDKK